jgi:hypothetical protein
VGEVVVCVEPFLQPDVPWDAVFTLDHLAGRVQ